MKRFKQLFAIFTALFLGLSLGLTSARAEGETTQQTITISNPKDGSTYSLYRVMDAKAVGEDKFTYTVTDNFKAFFEGNETYKLSENNEILIKDEKGKWVELVGDAEWTNTNTSDASKLAAALSTWAVHTKKLTPDATITLPENSATLPIGYYVLAETVSGAAVRDEKGAVETATKPVLIDVTKSKSVDLKKSETTLDKNIEETSKNDEGEETTSLVKSNNVNISDTIPYVITTKIPTYEANVDKTSLYFVLTDEFSDGLDYNATKGITVSSPAGLVEDKDYTVAFDAEKRKLTITFSQDAIYDNQGQEVEIHYEATLNENAEVDSTIGNPNKVTLEYTHNTNEDEGHKTLEDETKTYTYGFNLRKVDKAAPSESLGDAHFSLYEGDDTDHKNPITFTYDETTKTYVVDKDGTVTDIVSVGYKENADGSKEAQLAVIEGLEEGKYLLHETQAPDKYTTLANDVLVEITAVKDTNGKETGEAILTASGAGNAKAEEGTKVLDENGKETGSVESDGNSININVYVENTKGISLPETGALTALFCKIGGIAVVVVGAAYYFFFARRKNARSL